jgi:hypothetical protein
MGIEENRRESKKRIEIVFGIGTWKRAASFALWINV